jgi:sulfide dehydrogenase [flavocytochrome c] flavoprotein subunit
MFEIMGVCICRSLGRTAIMRSKDPRIVAHEVTLSRRSILAGGVATLAASVAPYIARAQAAARIVVVGGGWGGISAARHLKTLLPAADVTMVEPNAAFMSCPMSVHYIVGHRSAESLTRDYTALTDLGVRHVQEVAETIDRAARIVVTPNERLPYDFLVLSPGIDYMEDAIPGFAEHRDALPVGFRAFEQQAVRAALEAYDGGDIVLSVPTMPFRCPIAPYERAAMFAEWMNRHNKPGRVILLDQNPAIPIGRPVISAAFSELYPDRIEHRNGIEFQSVDATTRTIETNAGALTYGMAALVPPQQAASLIRTAGLGQRWARVSFPSFQSADDQDIYIVGDSVGAPLPKSGHLAFETGARVAQHIADRINHGQAEASLTLPSAICFAAFSETEAMGVNVTAQWDDLLQEVRRQPVVDPQRSGDALARADSWSGYVWDELLG